MMIPSFLRTSDAHGSIPREMKLALEAAQVAPIREAMPRMAAELRRCRRYERPLSVLAIGLDASDLARVPAHNGNGNGSGDGPNGRTSQPQGSSNGHALPALNGTGEAHGNGRHRSPPGAQGDPRLLLPLHTSTLLVLGWILRDGTRESDVICFHAEHQLYLILMPETGSHSAREAGARLAELFLHRTSLPLRAGMAAFPEDGFTVEDLCDRARAAWESDPHDGSASTQQAEDMLEMRRASDG